MKSMNEKFLNNLLTSISVSGFEEPVQDIPDALEDEFFIDEDGVIIE